MSLDYPIEIEKAHGEWVAVIPQVSRIAFCGSGDTVEKALEDLKVNKQNYFAECLEQGKSIPEPINDDKYIFDVPVSAKIYKNVLNAAHENNENAGEYIAGILESIFAPKKELVK